MPDIFEWKAFNFDTKTETDETGHFQALVSVFNIPDDVDEVVEPGAFSKTLSNHRARKNFKGFPVMYNHYDLIGITKAEKETDEGLVIDGWIDTETTLGKDKFQLMKSGVLHKYSFMYKVISDRREETTKLRYLTELKLFEAGPVDIPAHQDTRTIALKTLVDRREFDFLNELNAVIAKMPLSELYTDKINSSMEQAISKLRSVQNIFKPTETSIPEETEKIIVLDSDEIKHKLTQQLIRSIRYARSR